MFGGSRQYEKKKTFKERTKNAGKITKFYVNKINTLKVTYNNISGKTKIKLLSIRLARLKKKKKTKEYNLLK